MLLGPDSLSELQRSRVAVFGLGGVGSWCAEALCRSGVGHLTLIDEDTVSVTNINRQAEATELTIGMPKTEALGQRLLSVNPALDLTLLQSRYEASVRDEFLAPDRYDYIVDAIDLVSCKLDLIQSSMEMGLPIISALGTGNKADATQLTITDISKTSGCPFARVIRKELKARGIIHHTVVYSPEKAMTPLITEEPPPGRRSVPGSLMWVPASAGLLLAQHVVLSLCGEIHRQSE